MIETFRTERTELVSLLDELKDSKKESHKPEMYRDAIRQTRRKLLGLYRTVQNARKPVDIVIIAPVVV